MSILAGSSRALRRRIEAYRRVLVRERIIALGYVNDKQSAWQIGDAVRDAWEARTGALPEKRLERKTSGQGSHMLAVYPVSFVPEIDRIVHAMGVRK